MATSTIPLRLNITSISFYRMYGIDDDFAESWLDDVVSTKMGETPVCLFGQFVSAVPSDFLEDTRPRTEVN